MSKELKNFKITNKGGYPMNVVVCIEGYRLDKNPEDIINDLMKTEEGTLEGDKEYIERIEDCINSFVNLDNCYIEAFTAYFKENDSIDNMIVGTNYTEDMVLGILTKIIEILSLNLYSDIIFDSLNYHTGYTLDSSIIGLDTRFLNSLMRYRDNSYPNGIRTLDEIVHKVYTTLNSIEGQNIKDSVHKAFKDVRGIGNVYEASLEALYTLYIKYLYIHVKIEDQKAEDEYYEQIERDLFEGEKTSEEDQIKYMKYVDTYMKIEQEAENGYYEQIEQDLFEGKKISEKDQIKYCRNRVNLYDVIYGLKSSEAEFVTINLSSYSFDIHSLSRDVLLKALQMYYNFTYKENK